MRQLNSQEITKIAGATYRGRRSGCTTTSRTSCGDNKQYTVATCDPAPKPVCSPKPSCGSPAPAPAPTPAPAPAPAPVPADN